MARNCGKNLSVVANLFLFLVAAFLTFLFPFPGYTKLAEAFNSSLDLKDTVAYLLQEEGVAGYKHVAVNYKMKDLDLLKLRGCPKPGEEVLGYLESTNPDLTVYQFCKVLKGKKIRRLDIVNILVDYLMIDRNDARA